MVHLVLVELLDRRRAASVAVVDLRVVPLHAAAAEVVAEAFDADLARVRHGLDQVRHLLVLAGFVEHDVVDVLRMEVLDALQHEAVLLRLQEDALEVLRMPHAVARTERHPRDHRLASELTRHREVPVAPFFRMHRQT